MTVGIDAFRVSWPAREIDKLRDRVRAFEVPSSPAWAGDWRFGCPPDVLKRLCRYWVDDYDAAACVNELNRFPQFMTRIDGVGVHFVHVVGEAQGKRPLLLVHGWPGSIFEFWHTIERLAFPSRYGGRPSDAFAV